MQGNGSTVPVTPVLLNSCWLSRKNVVAHTYNWRGVAELFLDEKISHMLKHFWNEYFISKLAYLSDIFEKFSTLNPIMRGNDSNIIVVTDKTEGIY
jgi:hypothetical protein